MMSYYKERIKKSIEKFHEKQLPKISSEQRKNQKPEKHITKPNILRWLKQNDFLVFETEASIYDPVAHQYNSKSGLQAGFSDLVAISPTGQVVFLELKAPTKRSSLRPLQREFLLSVINHYGFACVTDSSEHLEKLWLSFQGANSKEDRKKILIDDLPKEPQRKINSNSDFPF